MTTLKKKKNHLTKYLFEYRTKQNHCFFWLKNEYRTSHISTEHLRFKIVNGFETQSK